ncbi:LOW QUALITY PROTEIN: protein-glutamine gamma-glutamyltransferase 2-like [Lethenteron reissneri]|uniref:LOW QUALITY PROTEIN: protein-glutamine gamma-glutamyltransferase 2-like n=1 Tax=Lethenteron reissneri TaxID=7753 RepID=UPI002AB5F1D9|nr:LOW QUALITY PROTEIN: protein-glutamine gamma-glutamyltransferase 2-like [Lethenteron reissneri]
MDPLELESFERLEVANQKAHHLEALAVEKDRLFLRRGQPFQLLVKFRGRLFSPGKDAIVLALHTGPSPSQKDGTLLRASSDNAGELSVTAHGSGDTWSLLEASTQASAPIGRYTAFLETRHAKGGDRTVRCFPLGEIVLLFNAWCKDDAVYMEDDLLRSEYVLNETGKIYVGSQDYISSVPWNFSQFARGLGDICFQILDKSNVALKDLAADTKKRGDPIHVSRVLSAMINSNDDKGVLQGNWSGKYPDGTWPTSWTGSADILRCWYKTQCQAVKYGQCWVFAGVACTVMRFFGLPTRCVTNFTSAHDKDGNLSCDRFYYESSNKQESHDSVWNFHVWVESWMSRKDIEEGYDGWQVVDPTPQERSEGVFCCGPAPVNAVRKGQVALGYETPFVFAEVNADVVMWSVAADGRRTRMSCITDHVGRCISTKRAGRDEREDITLQYKYPEGSKEERAAYARATCIVRGEKPQPGVDDDYSRPPRVPPAPNGAGEQGEQQEVVQGLVLRTRLSRSAFVGSDMDVHTSLRNPSRRHAAVVRLVLCARAVTYTGIVKGICTQRECTVKVPPGEIVSEPLRIKYKDYESQLRDQNIIRVTCAITLPGQETILAFSERNIILETPEIHVMVLGEPVVGRELKVEMSLVNPLPQPLDDGVFSLEGPGLTSLQQISCSDVVEPEKRVCVSASFCPSKPGLHNLIITFNSNRLRNVHGEARVIVRRA